MENTISSRPGFLIVALSTFWTDMSLLCGVVFCFYIGFFVCLFKNVVNYHKRWLKPHVVFLALSFYGSEFAVWYILCSGLCSRLKSGCWLDNSHLRLRVLFQAHSESVAYSCRMEVSIFWQA